MPYATYIEKMYAEIKFLNNFVYFILLLCCQLDILSKKIMNNLLGKKVIHTSIQFLLTITGFFAGKLLLMLPAGHSLLKSPRHNYLLTNIDLSLD